MSVTGTPATGAQTALYFIEEAVCNVTPDNPQWTPLRFTGGVPQLTREVLQSNELDGQREITDVRGGSQNAAGDINIELSHLSHATLISAALQSTFTAQAAINETETTIGFSATNNRISDSGSNNIFQNVLPGRKFTVAGSTSNNGTFTVARVVDNNTVEVDESITTEAAGDSVTITAASVMSARVGSTVRTFSILIQYNDLLAQPAYDIVTGVEFTGFSINLATNAIATATLSVIGRDYAVNQSLPAGSTFAPASTTRPYTGLDGAIRLDGEALGIVTSITPTLDNNANAEFAIGSRGVSYVSYGRANNTFDIATAFSDYALFERFINETRARMSLRLELDGNFLEFVYPKVQMTSGSPNPEGEGTITLNVSVQALRDVDAGSSVVISYNA